MSFLRTGTRRYKRLGRTKRKLQRWRKPRGRHSKIRETKKSRPLKVDIGYGTQKSERGKVAGKIPVFIANLAQAEKIAKGTLVIIARIGKKKRMEIEKKVREKGGEVLNQKNKLRGALK